jgi:hypothetical protein
MPATLLLDRSSWDLAIDVSGNIAVASEPYSQVQDVASACRLFLGEAWFATGRGIPYFSLILGKRPPLSLVKTKLVAAALTVPGVISAKAFLTALKQRAIGGQVQIVTQSGPAVVSL